MKLTHSLVTIKSVDDMLPLLKSLQKFRRSFFTSATWLEFWLRHTDSSTNKLFLNIQHQDKTIGIAIFDEIKKRRRFFFKPNILCMHDSIADEYDFTIEYNELLVNPEFLNPSLDVLLKIISTSKRFNEIKLNAVTSETYTEIESLIHNYPDLYLIKDKHSACQMVDLRKFTDISQYQQFLSKKRKYQLRKSEEYYLKFGSISTKVAQNINEAYEFFNELGVLHEKKWISKGQSGVFSNPAWVKFHKSIIKNEFNNNKIILFKLSAGTTTIGILYIFLDMNNASVIQTGFFYQSDKFAQPGFLTHYYFINYALLHNISEYNFLAGDNQYKRSLSTDKENLHWIIIQRKSLTSFIENKLVLLKRKIFKLASNVVTTINASMRKD